MYVDIATCFYILTLVSKRLTINLPSMAMECNLLESLTGDHVN